MQKNSLNQFCIYIYNRRYSGCFVPFFAWRYVTFCIFSSNCGRSPKTCQIFKRKNKVFKEILRSFSVRGNLYYFCRNPWVYIVENNCIFGRIYWKSSCVFSKNWRIFFKKFTRWFHLYFKQCCRQFFKYCHAIFNKYYQKNH